ncbi:DUF2935 domain-containing protein [Desulfosporosinus nitroreducens]|uniref:DUF2935 domain-containing protein n=1 Tax=Desulfosporosinus nitroreducens TaxID=2018668 RepID=A0ABT8QWU0_9FIRM|nr:DUF2935 domain-containing protein [Desulfosporosinus nitroreducens]MDO0825807.1 DUF2935 domain-containing protein [Desulfosporosinus nitroreducens]
MTAEFNTCALYEHRFWLQILGDHSRFFFKSLSPSEKDEIGRDFIKEFDNLLARTRHDLSREELNSIHKLIWQRVQQLKEFKFRLIRRHLEGQIGLNLPPSLVSHMVNELEEYQLILEYLIKGEEVPLLHPTHYHLIWLLDAVGHADSIAISLDAVEKALRAQGQRFNRDFELSYQKAIEMAGFSRAVQHFPELAQFNHQASGLILQFNQFLMQLQEMLLNKTALGIIDPLIPDHMLREECYYLTKLSSVSDVQSPSCDPGKPRIMEKL